MYKAKINAQFNVYSYYYLCKIWAIFYKLFFIFYRFFY